MMKKKWLLGVFWFSLLLVLTVGNTFLRIVTTQGVSLK